MSWLSDIVDNFWGSSGSDPSSANDSWNANANEAWKASLPNTGSSLLGGSTGGGTKSDSSLFTPGFFGDIIKAGAGLAGTYYTLDANKTANDQSIEQAQAALEFKKEELAQQKEIAMADISAKIKAANIAAGAAKKVAKLNNLGQLYQNWGSLTERGGESAAQSAQATGKMGQDPIIARLGVLR